MRQYGYELHCIVDWNNNRAIVIEGRDKIVVAFRGTDNLDNVYQDMRFMRTPVCQSRPVCTACRLPCCVLEGALLPSMPKSEASPPPQPPPPETMSPQPTNRSHSRLGRGHKVYCRYSTSIHGDPPPPPHVGALFP